MESFSYDKKLAPQIGSKPFFAFIGEEFESMEELKHLKEVLLDLFRGELCLQIGHFLTHCGLRLKKSGTIVPRMELVEVAPSMDLVVRRHRLPDENLRKQAMKTAPELTKKKEKNVSRDAIQGKIGKIYIPDQHVGGTALPNKAKGLKRERREARMKGGEPNNQLVKKQKQES